MRKVSERKTERHENDREKMHVPQFKRVKKEKKNSQESSRSDDDENKIPVYKEFVCLKKVIRNCVVGF